MQSAKTFVCIIAALICTKFGHYHFYGRLKLLCVLYKYSNTQLVIWYVISYEGQ